MTVWRYTAVPTGEARGARQRGELAGESSADVRAALRRIGLQAIDVRPMRGRRAGTDPSWREPIRSNWWRHLRARRRERVGAFYDSLGTMLDAGVPLLEGVSTISGGAMARRSSLRAMLLDVRESLRAGSSLAEAMKAQPAWFDAPEIAMIDSGQHTGELATVLHTLAERHERSGELSNKLAAALAYPAIITIVGLGVVVFLSAKTLPDLVTILENAGIDTPALTAGVMAFGGFLIAYGPLTLLIVSASIVILGIGRTWQRAHGIRVMTRKRCTPPRILRQVAIAEVVLELAEMMRTGVPVVESLRVLAPTTSGLGRARLRALLAEAAGRIERGEMLSSALDDDRWFDAELRRLIEIGESSGELPGVLQRVGEHQLRSARRAIDRLTAMLEPLVILALAGLIGLVVLAAILPLVRLQEMLG